MNLGLQSRGGGQRASAALWFPVPAALAPAGYRRGGQVLPFKADFPGLGCARAAAWDGPSALIKMCPERCGEEGEPSTTISPRLLSLISSAEERAKGRGLGSSVG